jgi:hypothetical protein
MTTPRISTPVDKEQRRARVLALRQEGKSIRQIAEELGVSKSTVADDLSAVRTECPDTQPDSVRTLSGHPAGHCPDTSESPRQDAGLDCPDTPSGHRPDTVRTPHPDTPPASLSSVDEIGRRIWERYFGGDAPVPPPPPPPAPTWEEETRALLEEQDRLVARLRELGEVPPEKQRFCDLADHIDQLRFLLEVAEEGGMEARRARRDAEIDAACAAWAEENPGEALVLEAQAAENEALTAAGLRARDLAREEERGYAWGKGKERAYAESARSGLPWRGGRRG